MEKVTVSKGKLTNQHMSSVCCLYSQTLLIPVVLSLQIMQCKHLLLSAASDKKVQARHCPEMSFDGRSESSTIAPSLLGGCGCGAYVAN